jgi:hypothetical protein
MIYAAARVGTVAKLTLDDLNHDGEKQMPSKPLAAFVTARKGFCCLTLKYGRRNFHMMRIRNYTLDAQDKRDMRQLDPDVVFDWKKITKQLAEKREACRCYRSRRRASARIEHARKPLYAVFDPTRHTVYANEPRTAGAAAALVDAILSVDRMLNEDS